LDYLQETGLTASAGIVPEVADLGVEAGLDVVLDEGIHDTHEQNADHNADDDTNSLVDIELGFGTGNGSLRLAVNLVALVVDGFLRAVEEILDFVEHGFLPFRF
jgi:hypothetical protein